MTVKKMRRTLASSVLATAVTAWALRALRPKRAVSYAGRTVLIAGGSRGLGLVMARLWAAEGARLALLARDEAELERARQDLEERGADVLTIVCDVRDEDDVNDAVRQIVEHYGAIDVLVNNAGVIQAGPIEHMVIDDFQEALGVHLWGPLYMMLAVVPHMRRRGQGSIVNITSIGGKVSVPHLVPYCTSKFALVGLSDGMRAELAKDGIRVTTVAPGLMRTGSHFNAFFKGQHKAEFTWFALSDSLPVTSIAAERAARQIIEACRNGAPQLVITLQARLAVLANGLMPNLTARALILMERLLPDPTGHQGDQLRSGWESQNALVPSFITRLSDQATVDNNELQGHAPPASVMPDGGSRRSGQ